MTSDKIEVVTFRYGGYGDEQIECATPEATHVVLPAPAWAEVLEALRDAMDAHEDNVHGFEVGEKWSAEYAAKVSSLLKRLGVG